MTCILPAPLRPYPGGARDDRPEEASSWSGGLSPSWPPLTPWGLLTRPLLPSVGCGCVSLSCLDGVEWSGSESLSFQAAPFWPLGSRLLLVFMGDSWERNRTAGARALDGSQGPAPAPGLPSRPSASFHTGVRCGVQGLSGTQQEGWGDARCSSGSRSPHLFFCCMDALSA